MDFLTKLGISLEHLSGFTFGVLAGIILCIVLALIFSKFLIRHFKKKEVQKEIDFSLSKIDPMPELDKLESYESYELLFDRDVTKVFKDNYNLYIWNANDGEENIDIYFIINSHNECVYSVKNLKNLKIGLLTILSDKNNCDVNFLEGVKFKKELQKDIYLVKESDKDYLLMNVENMTTSLQNIPEGMDLSDPFIFIINNRNFACRSKNKNLIIRNYEISGPGVRHCVTREIPSKQLSESFLLSNKFTSVHLYNEEDEVIFFTKKVEGRYDLWVVKDLENIWIFQHCDKGILNNGVINIFVNYNKTYSKLVNIFPINKIKGNKTIPLEFYNVLDEAKC